MLFSIGTYQCLKANYEIIFCPNGQGGSDSSINWNGNWAFACDFHGIDLTNVRTNGADCGGKCAQTSGCTHFTWTTYNGGTRWMKYGAVSKNNVFSTNDQTMVCVVYCNKILEHPIVKVTDETHKDF